MATTTPPVLDGIYELDRTHSTVQCAVRHVGVSTFRSGKEDVKVTYFLVRDTGRRAKPEREVTWRSFSAAKKLVAFVRFQQTAVAPQSKGTVC